MLGIFKNLFGTKQDLSLVMEQGGIILDVRTTGEYKQGHGTGSKNIPLNDIQKNIGKIKKWDKPIITCCASGVRSASAARMLKRNNIEAYNGGSWQAANQLGK
jgi:phage shock protein E